MVSNLKINFWNIQGYVNLNIKTKKRIIDKILQNLLLMHFPKN
jgi:hypothetical protein